MSREFYQLFNFTSLLSLLAVGEHSLNRYHTIGSVGLQARIRFFSPRPWHCLYKLGGGCFHKFCGGGMCVFLPALYRSHTQSSGVQGFVLWMQSCPFNSPGSVFMSDRCVGGGRDQRIGVFALKSRQVPACYAPHVFSEVRNGAFGIH